ncbi:MAG: hypothetical protein U5R06_05670 [candidate division KSB1 bacterium]|nr:hypothetical protein [candidate division KSB1 bacterium]
MQRKYFSNIMLVIVLIFTHNLFSQISEEQARQDMHDVVNVDDYIYSVQNPEYQQLKQKLKNHPDVYIDIIEQEIHLPRDFSQICSNSILKYGDHIGLLFFFNTGRSRDLLYEQYQLQSALLRDIRHQVKRLRKLDYQHPDYEQADCAYQTIMLMQSDFIKNTTYYRDSRYIEPYLERFGEIEFGLDTSILEYFRVVALDNPEVITRLKQYYFDPGTERWGNPEIEETLIKMGHPNIDTVATYSVLALRSIRLSQNSQLLSGFAAIQEDTCSDIQDAHMVIENNARVADSCDVFAPSIQIRPNAEVYGNVYTNHLSNRGTITGAISRSLGFPILYHGLPAFPDITPGTRDIDLKPHKTHTLSSGSYRDVTLKPGCTLILRGGDIRLRNLRLSNDCEIRAKSPVRVLISQSFETGSNCVIASDRVSASEVLFYIAGSGKDRGNPQAAATIGNGSRVQANVYAPNGLLHIRQHCEATGGFIARDVLVGNGSVVRLDNGFERVFE